MNKTANDFLLLEEKNQQEAMRELVAKVSKEVGEFVDGWYKDMTDQKRQKASVTMKLEDLQKAFADWDIAAMMLEKMGFDVCTHKEKREGRLWWKKVTPARVVIQPSRGRIWSR